MHNERLQFTNVTYKYTHVMLAQTKLTTENTDIIYCTHKRSGCLLFEDRFSKLHACSSCYANEKTL